MGYDDHEWATIVEPPLTVIRQPAYNLGQQAADLVLPLSWGIHFKRVKGNPKKEGKDYETVC
ncbi:hypothetical protein [Sporomusa carbonis]|uniref:hypothetical protein n=1 Tax=Sporomusa carbonis TaxID=3076075 RepID=UPI003C7D53A8